jgi:hypothetical protein
MSILRCYCEPQVIALLIMHPNARLCRSAKARLKWKSEWLVSIALKCTRFVQL